MAKTEKNNASGSENVQTQSELSGGSFLGKYKKFVEEHFSREDHNTQEVARKGLTVKTKGTFDYVSIEWIIDATALEKDYPQWLINEWSLYGIRRFGDFTKLDTFPNIIDGEVFLKTSQLEGSHKEYLNADVPANYAFFLVGNYSWFWSLWYSHKKKLGPLTLSLTPLRASTKEMWKEIAEILNVHLSPAPGTNVKLEHKEALLTKFTEKEKAIRADPNMTAEEKDTLVERTWMLYELYGKDGE